MMNDEKKQVQITVNTGKDCFFYKGYILDDTEDYIEFEDFKVGSVKIYKNAIVAISEINGGIR